MLSFLFTAILRQIKEMNFKLRKKSSATVSFSLILIVSQSHTKISDFRIIYQCQTYLGIQVVNIFIQEEHMYFGKFSDYLVNNRKIQSD